MLKKELSRILLAICWPGIFPITLNEPPQQNRWKAFVIFWGGIILASFIFSFNMGGDFKRAYIIGALVTYIMSWTAVALALIEEKYRW